MNITDLNEMQAKAVRHTEGPLLIIAGAGSGKTRVLTYRAAYLLEEKQEDPYNILAITFTNKAAGEMRERISEINPLGSQIWVSTFHSMCVRILRRFADRIGYSNDFTIYDTDDSKSVMKELFKKNNINTKYYKEKSVLAGISAAKDCMKSANEALIEAGDDLREKTKAQLYSDYQKTLKLNNAMDFDDLIFNTVKLFQTDKEALEVYADRFRYIMVDEYQDTNTSQFMLISLLASKWKNICVVGDDDQSIYKFRGANVENILNFEKVFEGAEIIKLEQNYRSTQTILDAANSVIRNNFRRKDKSLWTNNSGGDKIALLMFDNGYHEAEGVAQSIDQMVRDGWNYDDFAILYRTNAQSRLLEEKLILSNIPYRIYGGVNFYQRKEIKDVISYLKALVNEADAQAIRRIINVPKRGIGPTTVDKVQRFADANEITFWEALKRAKEIPDIGKAYKKTDDFAEMIESFKEDAGRMSLEDLANRIINETGYIDMLAESETEEDFNERKDNIDELINKIIDYESEESSDGQEKSLSGFLEEVSLVADTGEDTGDARRISLMTIHSAKGLEFPVVYITGMEDGLFPSYMSIAMSETNESEIEEERRLCYVGITRAKQKLFLTFARERMVRGDKHVNTISRFVKEISDELLEKKNNSFVGDDFGFDGDDSFGKGSGFAPRNRAKYEFRTGGASAGMAYGAVKAAGKSEPTERSDAQPEIPVRQIKPEVRKAGDETFEKSKTAPFAPGDKVENDRFGKGEVTEVLDMGRDWMLTVDFEDVGVKKMFAGFINLKKI